MDLAGLFNHLQRFNRDCQLQMGAINDSAENGSAGIENTTRSPSLPEQRARIEGDQILSLLRTQLQMELPSAFRLADHIFSFCFMFEKQAANDFLLELSTRTFYYPQCDAQTIPFDLRVLATLSFLAHGHLEHIRPLDAFLPFRPNMLLRCVPKVCQQIVHFMTPHLVSFPHTESKLKRNKNAFLHQFGLPGIVGVLDCFHVRLSRINPQDLEKYTNRHGQTSINVQVICDRNLRFLDVNPHFSGICSDIHIWKRSHVRSMMQRQQAKNRRTYLVADRGYRLEGFLMNPYRNATTPAQLAVNTRLRQVRSVLDVGVAVLKARFLCLGSVLNFKHLDCANIITACVTLHNYLITKGVPIAQDLEVLVPKRRELLNAAYEDYSREGLENRVFLQNFLLNNPLQQLLGTTPI